MLFFLLILLAGGCDKPTEPAYQGYVEGEFVLVAAPLGGRLETLDVRQGQTVEAGDRLFTLEHAFETAEVGEGEKEAARADQNLADLTKGQRPTELAQIEAQLQRARADRKLSRVEFDRRTALLDDKLISVEELDQARTAFRRDSAAVAELEARLRTARLGARQDEIEAARSAAAAARQRLEQARWRLDQKTQAAPLAGLIFDTIRYAGEYVPAATPVISLLPPGNIKIRFFVPETLVGQLKIGQPVAVTFDGGDRSYRSLISYISPEAEYTPPVIFSRETRSKLVFMVEARPALKDAAGLHPGQPVEVRLQAPDHE